MNRATAYLMTMFHIAQGRFEGQKDRGATAVEYGLLVGLIAVAIISVVGFLGEDLTGLFQDVRDGIDGAATTTP